MKNLRIVLCTLALGFAFWSCKAPEARRPISAASGSFIDSSVQRNKERTAAEEEMIKGLIEADTANNYRSSESGFWYYYQVQDSLKTVTPKFGDVVRFTHTIKDLKNRTIYSQKELGLKTYAIDKEELFYGLREGLKLMKEGEKATFLFPSYQAYGYYGDAKRIGINIPLIVEVDLLEIIPEENVNTN